MRRWPALLLLAFAALLSGCPRGGPRAPLTEKIALAREQALKKDEAYAAAFADRSALEQLVVGSAPCAAAGALPGGSTGVVTGARSARFLDERFAISSVTSLARLHSSALRATLDKLDVAQAHVDGERPDWARVSAEVAEATSLDWGVEVLVVPGLRRAFLFDHEQAKIVCSAEAGDAAGADAAAAAHTVFGIPLTDGIDIGTTALGDQAAASNFEATVLKEVAPKLRAPK